MYKRNRIGEIKTHRELVSKALAKLKTLLAEPNLDIKPPLPVVDPERFYRSGEK
jgi:hypothetical protein